MDEIAENSDLLTLSEAAGFVRVSEETFGGMVRAGRIPSRKVGEEWRFSRSALDAWLAGAVTSTAEGRKDAAAAAIPPPADTALQRDLPISGFCDTAFSENHDRTLHRWVPWIAGFSSSFVAGVLHEARRGQRKLRVLDPFAGVGTTLIEALRHGDDAIGFEINPYAALACRAKCRATHYDAKALETMLARFEDYGERKSRNGEGSISAPPAGFRSRAPFFSPVVEKQVLACLDFVAEETTDWLNDLFRVALGAVMVGFSNYSYEPSLGTRAAAGKADVEYADVFGVVKQKLWEMKEDIVTFQRWMARYKQLPRPAVHAASYLEEAHRIEPNSIDVLVTSPPYLNNYHYIRNTRPHMFWLGMVQQSADLRSMERRSFGQFWQTVRTGPKIELQPRLPHLAERLENLRALHAEKGPYGGPGWANYAAAYFNDCQRFCAVTRGRMRSGGAVVVVIGNNILQGVEFKTDELFAEIAEKEGFEIISLHEVRRKRTGNSIVNSSVRVGKVKQRTRLYETAVELRAP